jgi:hypothetical protein
MRRAILFFFLFQVLFAVHAYAESKEDLGDVMDSWSQHSFLEATKKPYAIIDKNRQDATATSLKAGDGKRAIDDYAQGTGIDPNNALSHLARGDEYPAMEKYRLAQGDRSVSMKMRHFHKIFSVLPHRSLAMVC